MPMVHLGLSFTVTLRTMHQTPHWETTRKANISRARGYNEDHSARLMVTLEHLDILQKVKLSQKQGNAVLCMKQNKSQCFQMFPFRFFLLYTASNCRLPLVIAFQDIPQLFSILNLNAICHFLKCVIDSF